MFRNYFKIAFRNLWKNKVVSSINILGLAVGICCCLLITLFVKDEWSYDQFHQDAAHIYRLTTIEKTEEGTTIHQASAYPPVAPLLQSAFPELDQVVRVFPYNVSINNPARNVLFQEKKFYFADSLFFELFSFPFVKGDPLTALKAPNSIVLTRETAKRYFGSQNPLGKTLKVEKEYDFVVSGVVENLPKNSSLQFDFVAAMPSINNVVGPWVLNSRKSWHYPPIQIFVKADQPEVIQRAQAQMGAFEKAHLPDYLLGGYQFQFQALTDVHFKELEGDISSYVRPSYLYILMLIAFMILAIACVNYINLSLSRLVQRLREIGIRRVLGAFNRQILLQILNETVVYLGVAVVLGLLLVNLMLPGFNQLLDKNLVLWTWENIGIGLGMAVLAVLIAVVVSLFPAISLFRFQLNKILKAEYDRGAKSHLGFSFKNSFVVFQFTVATSLIIATLIVQYQLSFIRNKDLGMQADQTIVVPIRDEAVQQNFSAIKNNFASIAGVVSVSALSNFPWEEDFYDFPSELSGQGKKIETDLPTLFIDEDFLETMGMEVIAGRGFLKNSQNDQKTAFLMNEAAAKKYNITDVEGIQIVSASVREPIKGNLIGIVKDFHMKSLHHPVDPVIMAVAPESYYIDNFVVRLNTKDLPQTLDQFSKKWADVAPGRPFEYFFMDEAFEQLYSKEARQGKLFSYFTILALFIACLGMFALAIFASERRTKEIGIRKVLGASVLSIASLLTKDFLKLVLLAILIASPIAWYFMNQWLADFAYRIDIQWWMFVVAGVLAVAIAFLTIGFQSVKAALANPVKSLRSE